MCGKSEHVLKSCDEIVKMAMMNQSQLRYGPMLRAVLIKVGGPDSKGPRLNKRGLSFFLGIVGGECKGGLVVIYCTRWR